MATKFFPLAFIAATFLQLSLARPGSTPSLILQPEPSYFVGKDRPVKLICSARNAEDVSFSCVGMQIPPSSTETEEAFEEDDGTESQYVISVQSSITVPRHDVINYERQQRAEMAATGVRDERPASFWCQCSVLDIDGEVVETSRRSIIRVAHLRHRWTQHPENTLVDAGTNAELFCEPPAGYPEPTISWTRDSVDVSPDQDDRFVITDRGSLVITDVTEEDAGVYQCQATNVAGTRYSRLAQLSVAGPSNSPHPTVIVSDGNGQRVEIVKSRSPRQSPDTLGPQFTIKPEKDIFVSKERPEEVIKCFAIGVDLITFFCNGRAMVQNKHSIQSSVGQTTSGAKIMQNTLKVNFTFVKKQNSNRLHCFCQGFIRKEGGVQKIATEKSLGHVHIAKLDQQFRREPENAMLREGANEGVIHCRLPHGEPTPWLKWYKDGQELDLRRDDSKFELKKQNLVIKDIEMSDAGDYVCQAQNIAGIRRSRAGRIRVLRRGEYRPTTPAPVVTFQFVQDLPAESAIGEDGTVDLECSSIKVSRLVVRCDGRRLGKDSYTVTTETNDDNMEVSVARFSVTNAMVGSRDDYSCQCIADEFDMVAGNWNRYLSTKGVIKASETATEDAYLEEEFVKAPENKIADFGRNFRLTCKAPAGKPEPVVYWLKDGQPIDLDIDRNVRFYRRHGLLYFQTARAEDEGMYTCVAENSAGRRTAGPVKVEVQGKPTTAPPTTPEVIDPVEPDSVDPTEGPDSSEPFFVQEPAALTYIGTEDAVNLTCQVVDTQTVFFYCNDDRQDHTNVNGGFARYERTQRRIATSYMTVTRDMVSSHSGEFSCRCEYHYRTSTGYEDVSSSDAVVKLAYLKEAFSRNPRALTGIEMGSELRLECIPPLGEPEPLVMWEKDGARVQDSDRVNLQGRNLVINDFMKEDEGRYVCVARNLAGSRYSNAVPVYTDLVIEPSSEPSGSSKMPEPVTDDGGAGQPEPEPETTPGTGTGGAGVITDPSKFYSPYFSKDLSSSYYVVDNKPAVLECEAYNIREMEVACYGRDLDESELTVRAREVPSKGVDDKVILQRLTNVQFEVTAQDLQGSDGTDGLNEYGCACYGLYEDSNGQREQIQSKFGRVYMAYIEDQFQKEPTDSSTAIGGFTMLQCSPPQGTPPPKISWMKDGQPVTARMAMVMPTGQLVMHSVRAQDKGTYVCVAENEAGRRETKPVYLDVTEAQPATDSVLPGGVGIVEGGSGTQGVTDGSQPDIEDSTPDGSVVLPGGSTGTDRGTGAGGEEEGATSQKEEGSCIKRSLDCEKMAPRNYDTCQDTTDFEECMRALKEDCQDELSPQIINTLEIVLEKCRYVGDCKMEMERCHPLHDNEGKFDAYLLCGQLERYISCTDTALGICGADMYYIRDMGEGMPFEEMTGFMGDEAMDRSMDHGMDHGVDHGMEMMDEPPEIDRELVTEWFQDYCDKLVNNGNTAYSVGSCSTIDNCPLRDTWKLATEVQADNNTYWCKAMRELMDCSNQAVNECGLEELKASEENLFMKHQELCEVMLETLEDTAIPPTIDEEGGEDGSDKGMEGTDKGTDEKGSDGGGTSDAGAAATKQDDKDSSSAVSVSIFLTVFLQLAVAAILSRR